MQQVRALLAVLTLAASGCGAAQPPSPATNVAVLDTDPRAESGSSPAEAEPPRAHDEERHDIICSTDASGRRLIASGEPNTNLSELGGYFYTFVDGSGSSIWPTSGAEGGVFTMTEGGAEGTRYAAHIEGRLVSAPISYAGMGLNFVDPKGPFDAASYYAVSFYARRGASGAEHARLVFPDRQTDPDGGVCRECFNDFGIDLPLDTSWQRYLVPFAALRQQPGWGSPRPPHLDKSAIFGLQLRATHSGAAFDLWIDQIEFLACPEPAPPPV